MKSKTKISKQENKKTNPELVKTLRLAKKNKEWLEVASILAGSRDNWKNLNLNDLEKNAKEGETILVAGKVLGDGELTKKLKIVAFNFSESAREKILKVKGEVIEMIDEIKKNPSAKGMRKI